ncbi:MAG: 30S ribosomal protein S5 [Cytophagales bacterium]|nr:30S ribosomal protein S5 [Cytophagales bacterium]
MDESGIERLRSSEIELKEKVVKVSRVVKVVKGGRRFSFSAVVVIGDKSGVVGYGLGKANEATDAITKGIENAKKNLIRVPLIGGTIPHELYGKFGGGRVYVRPASPGTGLIAGGGMRAVLESAGVQDCLAKSKGSSNPHNVVKATFYALADMRDARTIAKQRRVPLEKVLG